MKRLYQAFDGQIFDNEQDCIDYESSIQKVEEFSKHIVGLDNGSNILYFSKNNFNVFMNNAEYIAFETDEAALSFTRYAKEENYSIQIDSKGIYKWEEYEDNYININTILAKIVLLKTYLNDLKNKRN